MPRLIFAFIILVHSLIHLLGFLKAFGHADPEQLSGEISKPLGLMWLLATVMLILTEILFILKKYQWWMVAMPAILISQFLIARDWADTRYGTVLNIILLIVGIIAFAEWNFNRKARKESAAMLSSCLPQVQHVDPDMINKLPPIIQKWMWHSGVSGRPKVYTVRLKQKGMMRSKPAAKWMSFTATQYFTTCQPAFNWQAKVNLMPLIYMNGRDKYENGRGEMLIRLLSLKTVADSKGSAEIDQAALLRYLAEICWFPSAAMSDYIKWETIDDRSAKAVINYNGTTAEAVFFFNRHAEVTGFEAMRFAEFDGKYSLEKWDIKSMDYKEFDGIRIPTRSEVTWKLKTGDFTWLKLELETVEYNKKELWTSQ